MASSWFFNLQLGCYVWPRTAWHFGPLESAHCQAADATYQTNICVTVGDRLHLESAAFWEKFVMHQTLHIGESSQHCLGFWPDLLLFDVGGDVFHCDDFFFVRIAAVIPYFFPCNNAQQEGGIILRMLRQFTACYCRLFHGAVREETWLHCRAPHSPQSQPAIAFSGMWHQKILPNIRCRCHFDTVISL